MKPARRNPLVLLTTLLACVLAQAQVLYLDKDEEGKPSLSTTPTREWRKHVSVAKPAVSRAVPQPKAATAKAGSGKPATRSPPPVAASGEVVLFAADWCGYCRQARRYLRENGIAYSDINVDTAYGAEAFARVSRSRGIPLLLVGGKQVRGFSVATYDRVFQTRQ